LPYIDKGDSEKVSFRGKVQTLHEVWDSGILETEEGSAKQIAKRLDEKITDDDRKACQSGTPKDWANESIAINTRYVYPLPENHEFSEEYAKRAVPILHKRLAQADVRLAWLLMRRSSSIEAISRQSLMASREKPAWRERMR
jgi:hypothetical protein